MSRFWPRAEYAEDQPFGKSILAVHVLDRGSQLGSVIGMDAGLAWAMYKKYKLYRSTTPTTSATVGGGGGAAAAATSTAESGIAATSTTLSHTVKRFLATPAPMMRTVTNSTGLGAVAGVVVMAGLLPLYMRGKTHVEWQDRSWRLLDNPGQVEVDDWSWIGAVAGVSTAFVPRWNRAGGGRRRAGFTCLNLVGRGSIGALVGVVGYLGWRYGVMRGHRKGDNVVDDTALPFSQDRQSVGGHVHL